MNSPLAIFLILSALTYASCRDILRFEFGGRVIFFQIDIEVFDPQGIRVSIPHVPNLEVVSFHGKVMSPFDRSNGMNFAQDVTRRGNGKWVYETESVKLQVGDVLNYWIFLQYRGTGKRFNNLSYIVTDLKPAPSTLVADSRPQINSIQEVARISTTRRPPQRIASAASPSLAAAASPVGSVECPCNEETLNDVWTRLNKTKIEMQALEETVTPLKNKLSSLTEALDELVKSVDIGTELLLTGTLPVRSNPVEDVRHLLVEKLKLNDLSSSILQAEYTASGISFEVATSIDKLRILKRAKDLLVKLPYQIVDLKGQPVLDIRSSK